MRNVVDLPHPDGPTNTINSFLGIYKFIVCRRVRDMVKLYAISFVSQLIGLFFAEYLMYIISLDYKDFEETPAIMLINICMTLIIDIVFIICKFFRNIYVKRREA